MNTVQQKISPKATIKKYRVANINTIFIILLAVFLTACTISYKFNGASIDYSKTKTISISDFPNRAPLVNPLLAPQFSESLRELYTRQTRLKMITNDGDMQLSGEITGYDLAPMSMQSDALAAETKLTVTIQVRYVNKNFPSKDFEKSFSAYQTFQNTSTLSDVEAQLCNEIIKEITENIYNETAADW